MRIICWFSFQLHNYEIRPGKQLKVNISIANVRLFVGNIPKNKSKDEIKEEFGKRTGTRMGSSNFFWTFKFASFLPMCQLVECGHFSIVLYLCIMSVMEEFVRWF